MDASSIYEGKFERSSAIPGSHREYSRIRSTSQSPRSRIRGSQISGIVVVCSLANRARSQHSREENPSLNDSAGRLPPETLRWAETTSATARMVSSTRDGESTRRELLPCLAALSPPRTKCIYVHLSCMHMHILYFVVHHFTINFQSNEKSDNGI